MLLSNDFVGVEGRLSMPAISALSLLYGGAWVLDSHGIASKDARGRRSNGGFRASTREARFALWMSRWQPRYVPKVPQLSGPALRQRGLFAAGVLENEHGQRAVPKRGSRVMRVGGAVGIGALAALVLAIFHYSSHHQEAASNLYAAAQPGVNAHGSTSGNTRVSTGQHVDFDLPKGMAVPATPASGAVGQFLQHPALGGVSRTAGLEPGATIAGAHLGVPVRAVSPHSPLTRHAPEEHHRIRKSTGVKTFSGYVNPKAAHAHRHVANVAEAPGSGRVQARHLPKRDAFDHAGQASQRDRATAHRMLPQQPAGSQSESRAVARDASTGWMQYMKQRRLTEIPQEFVTSTHASADGMRD